MSDQFPKSFLQRMKTRLGDEFDTFNNTLNQPAELSLRINPKKYLQPVDLEPVPWSNNGFYLTKRPFFALDPLFHAGCYYVQEASSMLLEAIFNQLNLGTKELKVLDLCGAPGGKSTHLLSLISEDSLLISNEVIRSRADILKENIIKWGFGNAIVTNNDPRNFSNLSGYFDLMVIDAPCSGEGLFRKDPAAIDQWSEGNLKLCCERQERILHDVWPSLKEDGFLIYSTCTYNPEENEFNIEKLVNSGTAVSLNLEFPIEWGIHHVTSNEIHGYYCYPHKVRGEGFFFTVLQKKEKTDTIHPSRKNKKYRPAKVPEEVCQWVKNKDDLFVNGQEIISFPHANQHELDILKKYLKIVSTGTTVGTVVHNKIIPDPALSLSLELNSRAFNLVNLSYEEALQFLRKETFNHPEFKSNYNLISFNGTPLGWIKSINPNRSNNYFPKEWRLRMDLPQNLKELQQELPLK